MCRICNKQYDRYTSELFCCSIVTEIPDILVKLTYLNLPTVSKIRFLPNTLINLREIWSYRHLSIIFIPDTLTNLRFLYGCNTLVSPQILIKETNNRKYQIFKRCQKKYKYKLHNRKLKISYNQLYIVGYITKLQLNAMFN